MSDEKDLDIIKRFDTFVNKCIKNFSINYDRDERQKWYNNILFYDNISEIEDELDYVEETFFSESKIFDIDGILIEVNGEKLISAIEKLPEDLKKIILLYYFDKYSDEKVAKHLNKIRKTINRKRNKALLMLKDMLLVYGDED